MNIEETEIPGILILTPQRFGDVRGWFCETWNSRSLKNAGIALDFVQDNHSFTAQVGTVRGLHFQSPPHAQDKLVRVVRGRIFDVAVDIRSGSPTYGRWVGVELSAKNNRQVLVPKGFLHGFVTCEADTEVVYKCSDYFAPKCDGAVRFDDPGICIDWGIDPTRAVLSDKDASAPLLKTIKSPFVWEDPR